MIPANIQEKLEAHSIEVDVREAVESLTKDQRMILSIKYHYGFAAKIIADATCKSVHTVNQQIKLLKKPFKGMSMDEIVAALRKSGITLAIFMLGTLSINARTHTPRQSRNRQRVVRIERVNTYRRCREWTY